MSKKLFSPCPQACCSAPPSSRLTPQSRSSALLRVLRLPWLILLRASVPAVLPLVVLRPDLSLAFRPMAPRAHLRATSPAVRLVSMVLADCMVSIAAARPISAVSRVATRGLQRQQLHPQ